MSVGLSLYHPSLLGNNLVKAFPWQRRIVGGLIFHVVCVVSQESRQLVLPRISCLNSNLPNQMGILYSDDINLFMFRVMAHSVSPILFNVSANSKYEWKDVVH